MSLGLREGRNLARRRRRWRFVKWLFLLLLITGLGVAGFQSGKRLAQGELYQAEDRIERLSTQLAELQRSKAELQVALERAKTREEDLQQRYARDVPAPALRSLMTDAEKQLAQGATLERLRFLVSAASEKAECDGSPRTKRFIVRTPLYDGASSSVTFADGRLTVTASGAPTADSAGRVQAWFDPSKPIELRVVRLGGDTESISGTLPVHVAIVLDGDEYRLSVTEGEQRGFVEATADRCRFPAAASAVQ